MSDLAEIQWVSIVMKAENDGRDVGLTWALIATFSNLVLSYRHDSSLKRLLYKDFVNGRHCLYEDYFNPV